MKESLALVEIARRLENLIRIGTVAEVDTETARARVQSGEILTDWLPWLTQSAATDVTWWAPEVGEQVLVLSQGGNISLGVILPALYQNAHPAPETNPNKRTVKFSDGAIIEYDREAHHLKAVLPAGATTELVSDGGVSIKGDLAVEGSITATVDITAEGEVSDTEGTLARLRENYNTHTHIGNMGSLTSATDKVDA